MARAQPVRGGGLLPCLLLVKRPYVDYARRQGRAKQVPFGQARVTHATVTDFGLTRTQDVIVLC